MFKFLVALAVSLPLLCSAQDANEFIEVVKPKPFSFSNNIVFVVDASSSINNSEEIGAKFEKAWAEVTNRIASDELYFCVFTFHDKGKYAFRKWVDAGGPAGLKEFEKARRWVRSNTGTYSWGQKALGKALTLRNKMNTNKLMNKSLSVVLITDGGFTEAAKHAFKNEFDPEKDDPYQPILDEIRRAQAWRKLQEWPMATITTVGIENTENWSLSVKRTNRECQSFLKKIGRQYLGGYYLVRRRK